MMTATAKNTTKKQQEGRKSNGLGLDSIGDLSDLLDTPAAAGHASAGPVELPLT